MVRIATDELSYIDGNAWNDIYAKSRPQLKKDPEIGPPPPDGVKGLAFAESDDDHNRMRYTIYYTTFRFTDYVQAESITRLL